MTRSNDPGQIEDLLPLTADQEALFRRARPRPLSAEALARIGAGLADRDRATPGRPILGDFLGTIIAGRRALALAGLLVAVAGGAGATVAVLITRGPQVLPPDSGRSAPNKPHGPRRQALGESVQPAADAPAPGRSAAISPGAPPPEALPLDGARTSPRPRPRIHVRNQETGSPHAGPDPAVAPLAAGPSETSLGAEADLLGEAVRAIRQRGDAATGLALLDRYEARFPNGALADEAALARVDGLRLAGKRVELLALLDRTPVDRMPRGRALGVLRGELRLGAGRTAEALADFEDVLSAEPGDEVAERALYGRASCRSSAGDSASARADLRLYLDRFPHGQHAAAVRAMLSR